MSQSGQTEAVPGSAATGLLDCRTAAIILLVTFTVFFISPVRPIHDSAYTMLFSQQLLRNHRFDVESKAIPELNSRKPGEILKPRIALPYQLYQDGERFYDFYPPGSAILSMPYVAVANLFGASAVDRNGVHNVRGEARIQWGLAALLMALFSSVVFLISRQFLALNWSVLITGATAFGSQIWSMASRSVSSQTWGILLLGIAVYLLVRAETRRSHPPAILLATCLSWLYFTRPTFSISIIAITVYIFLFHRSVLRAFVVTGAVWLIGFVVFSELVFGRRLPPYYIDNAFPYWPSAPQALPGNLVSPSRGLLIYVPILFFVGYLLIRYRSAIRHRLVILAMSVVIAHLVVCSLVRGWHGGHCYGPRLTMDVVPWLALLGVLAVQARLIWHDQNAARDSKRRIRIESVVAGLLLTCSVLMNGTGAISWAAWKWNIRPNNIDHNRSRLWDWKHPQFLAPFSKH